MVTPERVEHVSKWGQLFVPLHEQGAAGVEHLVTRVDIDVRQRFSQIEDTPDRHVEADAPEQPAEGDEVLDEVSALPERV